ncbi:hypothetical protein NM688_g3142 [Phlebia brevispora]|uniref:Uncharacterized protein n=1 Tax=Phlebia brevispora TaxID=194682 RepID=A0ACC1T6K7_9APHY|nr:hypothetical protein NM688_g3142 [Phlebia brevispora]
MTDYIMNTPWAKAYSRLGVPSFSSEPLPPNISNSDFNRAKIHLAANLKQYAADNPPPPVTHQSRRLWLIESPSAKKDLAQTNSTAIMVDPAYLYLEIGSSASASPTFLSSHTIRHHQHRRHSVLYSVSVSNDLSLTSTRYTSRSAVLTRDVIASGVLWVPVEIGHSGGGCFCAFLISRDLWATAITYFALFGSFLRAHYRRLLDSTVTNSKLPLYDSRGIEEAMSSDMTVRRTHLIAGQHQRHTQRTVSPNSSGWVLIIGASASPREQKDGSYSLTQVGHITATSNQRIQHLRLPVLSPQCSSFNPAYPAYSDAAYRPFIPVKLPRHDLYKSPREQPAPDLEIFSRIIRLIYHEHASIVHPCQSFSHGFTSMAIEEKPGDTGSRSFAHGSNHDQSPRHEKPATHSPTVNADEAAGQRLPFEENVEFVENSALASNQYQNHPLHVLQHDEPLSAANARLGATPECHGHSRDDSTFLPLICCAFDDVDPGNIEAVCNCCALGVASSPDDTSPMSEARTPSSEIGTDLQYGTLPSDMSIQILHGFCRSPSFDMFIPESPIRCISPRLLITTTENASSHLGYTDASYPASLPNVPIHSIAAQLNPAEGYAADDEDEDEIALLHPPTKHRDTKIKQKSPKKQKLPKQKQPPKRREPKMVVDHAIHTHVRTAIMHLLGLNKNQQPTEPPTPAEVSSFVCGVGKGPSMSSFRLDYNSPAGSLYNQAAFREFGAWFAERVAAHIFPDIMVQDYMTSEYFCTIARSKYAHIRDTYRARVPVLNAMQEARAQQRSVRQEERNAIRRRDRRQITIFKQRKSIIDNSPHLTPCLELLRQLLTLMGKDGMSSDETEPEAHPLFKSFRRKRRPWVNPVITRAFKWLDSCRLRPLSDRSVFRNIFPRRLPDHRADSVGEPKPGLPRNVYDPTFFEALSPHRKELLQVTEELDLSPLMDIGGPE